MTTTAHQNPATADTLAHLREMVRALARARAQRDEAKGLLATARQEFEAAHSDLIRRAADATERSSSIEETVRQLAVAHYRATAKKDPNGVGETRPVPGVAVTRSAHYEYPEDQALEWAEAREMCIIPRSLDKAAFALLCKEPSLRPGFVREVVGEGTTIARDLTPVIEQIGATDDAVVAE